MLADARCAHFSRGGENKKADPEKGAAQPPKVVYFFLFFTST